MRQGPESESPAHERLRLRLHTPDYIMSGIAEKVFKVIGQRSKVKGQTIPIKAEAYILTAWRRSSIVFYCIDLKRLHSSTKKVMFHTGFVCLSVCLSVSNFTQNYQSELHENITRDISVDKEEITKFWK